MTKVSDYYPLSQHLLKQEAMGVNHLTISFEEIEKIIKKTLPPTSRNPKSYQSWWSNSSTEKSRQCAAWLDYGWVKDKVDLEMRIVVFVKAASEGVS